VCLAALQAQRFGFYPVQKVFTSSKAGLGLESTGASKTAEPLFAIFEIAGIFDRINITMRNVLVQVVILIATTRIAFGQESLSQQTLRRFTADYAMCGGLLRSARNSNEFEIRNDLSQTAMLMISYARSAEALSALYNKLDGKNKAAVFLTLAEKFDGLRTELRLGVETCEAAVRFAKTQETISAAMHLKEDIKAFDALLDSLVKSARQYNKPRPRNELPSRSAL